MNSLPQGLALIFDLDGVIVDSNPVHEEAWRLYARRFGVELDGKMLGRMYGRRNDDIVRDFFGGQLTMEEIGARGAEKEALYRRMMQDQLDRRLVTGIRPFLEKFNDAPIGLATNAEPANTEFVLDGAGLRRHFRVVIDGHQVRSPKPDPQIYLLTARLLCADPRNCIVFEDSHSGVEAARTAGARVVALTTTHSRIDQADLNIQDFLSPELEPWLNRQTLLA